MTDLQIVAGVPIFRTQISSISPQANKLSTIRKKWNQKPKEQKAGIATRSELFLKYLVLDVALKILISAQNCILLICINSKRKIYEWTVIGIIKAKWYTNLILGVRKFPRCNKEDTIKFKLNKTWNISKYKLFGKCLCAWLIFELRFLI